ncbi:MAG: STAS domain-containing protein [Saccharofermentans sp.]|jgi:anti-sigma B factor antagonist|nr:STAS domain-containing protein [Saccharofermentans sp.]
MEAIINKDNEKLTVEVSGRLDTLTAPEFESKVEPQLSGIKELVVDLKDLEYISSAGLRVLMGFVKIMQDQGEMKVINPNEVVMDVFSLTGFDSILNIV